MMKRLEYLEMIFSKENAMSMRNINGIQCNVKQTFDMNDVYQRLI